MRTTITLDPDVAVRLRRLADERRMTFEEAVNSSIRAGLDRDADQRPAAPYVLPTYHMGVRPGIDLRQARHLDAEIEDEEIVRKLSLRK